MTLVLDSNPFVWLGQEGILLEMTQPYWLSWVVAFGILGWTLVCRRRLPVRRGLGQRGGADSTYFVAVFFWAFETAARANESIHWGHFSTGPLMPVRFQALLAAAMTLIALLCLGVAAEAVARRRGRPARVIGWSIPLPASAAIASGFGMWLIAMAPFCWR
jgi:hypothetical protein